MEVPYGRGIVWSGKHVPCEVSDAARLACHSREFAESHTPERDDATWSSFGDDSVEIWAAMIDSGILMRAPFEPVVAGPTP